MTDHHRLELPINKCFTTYDQSFNRVKYFSAITDNLTKDLFPDEWVINNPFGINYAMKDVPDNKKNELLQGYKHFMQCYLVRDCIESFAICLDKLFLVLLINGKRIKSDQTLLEALSDEEREKHKLFEKAGLSSQNGKVQQLKNLFALPLSKEHNQLVTSLKDIRNCFAHGNGFVRDIDGKPDGKTKRKFHWATFSVFGIGTKSGNKFDIEIGKPLEEESYICGKIELKDNSKSFRVGEQLSFSSKETYEIAWSLQLVAREYLNQIRSNILEADKQE